MAFAGFAVEAGRGQVDQLNDLAQQALGLGFRDPSPWIALQLEAVELPLRTSRDDVLAKLDGRMPRVVQDRPALRNQELDERRLVLAIALAIQLGLDQPVDDGNHLSSAPKSHQGAFGQPQTSPFPEALRSFGAPSVLSVESRSRPR